MDAIEHSMRARAARAKEEAAREDEVFAAERASEVGKFAEFQSVATSHALAM